MAEYRLEELARISGVSARNIRAYRERGLLDAPRRVGRSAFYDDYHLSQLRTINQLLRRGFNSAHIAEFFASMRQGADLADILGIQRALLGPTPNDVSDGASDAGDQRPSDDGPIPGPRAVRIDPDGEAARKLIELGFAEARADSVVVVDPSIAEILGRTSDQLLYVRALLRIYESSRDAADGLVSGFVRALGDSVEAKFGKDHRPKPREVDDLGQMARDYRELWGHVLSIRMEESLRRQLATAASGHPAGGLLSELLRRCAVATPG
ncbi:MerR family transcriptional regulator [Mycolicibacterium tusciae]|uniref:MerR family transcriptional regulator n=1 Tax=Mycolicibacterium tusciae TaxID=75922 RepID=A0A1X0JTQ7_9MYCO|nr:MerR family transcriptional regulator [Mycolicibacterium tusciae]ORB65676.1 MerR family transcriptional regulator [Mycolicibacterium tusciae]